jgi:two-component system capsular synthesis response regulator RcsB
MFKKILIAEDIDSIQNSVVAQVAELTGAEVQHSKYCDEAYLKIKKAKLDEEPFDLLITDLSFAQDHRQIILSSGEELIRAARESQPNLKIIAYSIEDKSFKIKHLFDVCGINGYVSKGRYGSVELEKAILFLANADDEYIDSKLSHVVKTSKIIEIEEFDLKLIKYLSNGLTQTEIVDKFKKHNIPTSNSSIEKRILKLKTYFKAKNTIHLISNAKDLGLI